MKRLLVSTLCTLKQNIQSCVLSILALFVLSIALVFTLAFPSYVAYLQRGTEPISWSVAVDYESTEENQLDKIEKEIAETFSNSSIVEATNTDSVITTDARVLTDASQVSLLLVPASFLDKKSQGYYPSDIFVPEAHLLSGNPHEGNGFVIDALTAQTLGVSVGDKVYVGYACTEGDNRAQTVEIEDPSKSNKAITVESVFFKEEVINAIAAPSSLFNGVVGYLPQETIDAYEEKGEDVITQLYVMSSNKAPTHSKSEEVSQALESRGIYLTTSQKMEDYHKESYALNKGSVTNYIVFGVVSMFIVLLIVVLDGIRKQQRNMRESAIRLSLGERRTTAVAGYAVGNVIFYAPLAVLAFFVGHAFAQLQFATWIPFDVFSTAAVVVAALMGVSLLVVCVIYAIRLKKLDIYGFLTSERG